MNVTQQGAVISDEMIRQPIVCVRLSTHISAQGKVIERLDDGRVTIDCSNMRYTGYLISQRV